ncbi:GIP, partial [Symbiodinium sp. CCMP2456]
MSTSSSNVTPQYMTVIPPGALSRSSGMPRAPCMLMSTTTETAVTTLPLLATTALEDFGSKTTTVGHGDDTRTVKRSRAGERYSLVAYTTRTVFEITKSERTKAELPKEPLEKGGAVAYMVTRPSRPTTPILEIGGVHLDEERLPQAKAIVWEAAEQQLRDGRTVVFEKDEEMGPLWSECKRKWENYATETVWIDDHRECLRVRSSPPTTAYPTEIVDAEKEAPKDFDGARGITLGKNIPPHVSSALKRLHQNLGHPSQADFLRHLRLAGASPAVLKAAKTLQCQTCTRTKATAIAKPAAVGNFLQFNQVIGADLIYVHDTDGVKHELLSLVDFSSSYHIVIPVPRKNANVLEGALCDHWINVFGAPGTIAVDLENGLQKAFGRIGDWTGMKIRSCAGQAHYQAGFTERQGGIWKAIFNRINEEMSVTKDEIKLAIAATSNAKNELRKVSGYSPSQHVFGTTRNLPEDLLDGPANQNPGDEIFVGDKHAREVAIRSAARAAFHQVQVDQQVRRALHGRSRVQARDIQVGEQAFYYRKFKNSKRGAWHGPCSIIGREGPNYWVSRNGRCVMVSPEHIRPATPEELGEVFNLR